MTYEKPSLMPLASAVDAIQGGVKASSTRTDMAFETTVGAYESDE